MKSLYQMYEIVNNRLTYKGFITTTFFGVEGFYKVEVERSKRSGKFL